MARRRRRTLGKLEEITGKAKAKVTEKVEQAKPEQPQTTKKAEVKKTTEAGRTG